ncbi:sugar phosphate nucleotidyltransferase [Mechercharimyces sp. CAU 1602]|uniref:sugar phosphate nucleotidyltransferase n=1 Tax=Mechercharimyces sp. CAU 1602 TaxID=2973933 RepID=UPI0021612683|nr:sugar phosphate nucleotidyltransferase [Mechercharimyces sp. CAU 1602]MCS1350124.1 sugar phosphate nucleotidyltransferase [Mechercharimyces sp. CAU 1602]
MKAVILAGGRGMRLRPLTSHLPKPMVPLLNRPCMEYILVLLKQHGITDIVVAVSYLAEQIKKYFQDGSKWGVSLTYVEEEHPLGTAGGVKNCCTCLDETVLVISGDALTDINLTEAIAFHEEKQSRATILLSCVKNPLPFGVVMCDHEGRVERFIEKPGWSQVLSNRVNTGIYIIEARLLQQLLEDGEAYFEKDIFPVMLERRLPLYGFLTTGYWCDVGSFQAYHQAQVDMMERQVRLKLDGDESVSVPGIFIEQGAKIDPSATLIPPVYIGANSVIAAGATVGAGTVLGSEVHLAPNTKIKESILWGHTHVEKESRIEKAMLGRQVYVGQECTIEQGCVIGDRVRIGSRVCMGNGKRIIANANLTLQGQIENQDEAWGRHTLFYKNKVRIPLPNTTPALMFRLARAFTSVVSKAGEVVISSCTHPLAQLLKQTLTVGLCSEGVNVVDCGELTFPLARFAVQNVRGSGGVHLVIGAGEMVLQFIDNQGLPLAQERERKMEWAYQLGEDEWSPSQVGRVRFHSKVVENYRQQFIIESNFAPLRREGRLAQDFFTSLCCRWVAIVRQAANTPQRVQIGDKGEESLLFSTDEGGECLTLYDGHGHPLTQEQLFFLYVAALSTKQKATSLPWSAPTALEEVARVHALPLEWTSLMPRAVLEASQYSFHPVYDALSALVIVADYVGRLGMRWKEIVSSLPSYHMVRGAHPVPRPLLAHGMTELIAQAKGKKKQLRDGMKVYEEGGWVLIYPDGYHHQMCLIVHGKSESDAQHLYATYIEQVKRCMKKETLD